MAGDRSGWIELAKYPVLVFSIVIALIVVRYALDLEFGMITEVSTEGLKFSERSNTATLKALTELETKLNDLSVRLELVEKGGDQTVESVSQARVEAFSASQAVSDATTRIAQLSRQVGGEGGDRLTGWIWIGNYDGTWSKTTLARIGTGQPIDIAPAAMQPGTEYKVLGNMVVRDGLPPNTQDYYRARDSLGVAPRGSVVSLLGSPQPVDREFAIQYWAEIEYRTPAKDR